MEKIFNDFLNNVFCRKESNQQKAKKLWNDIHFGSGICVGFVMPLTEMLNPKYLGVDLGCGMLSGMFKTDKKLDLAYIDSEIKRRIPMGFDINDDIKFKNIPFNEVQKNADKFAKIYNDKFGTSYNALIYDEKWLTKKLKDIGLDISKFYKSIGSLGGGNHFMELGISELGEYWFTIHSGSRQFGLKIAEYWTKVANGKTKKVPKEYNDRLQDIVDNTPEKNDIPKRINELKKEFGFSVSKEFLTGDNMMDYLFDVQFAQQYASWSRKTMMETVKDILGITKFDDMIETIHNYVDPKDLIIRKGAIASYSGHENRMVIPFNMKEGLLICEGKSDNDFNKDYLYSAPHGSGRKFSRSEAKTRVNLKDFKRDMDNAGVYSTSVVKSTCDEAPDAYKSSKMIEKYLEGTATIIHRVKPILNIKDTGGDSMTWKERKVKKKSDDIKIKQERSMKRRR